MGASGGVVYMGAAFRMLASGLSESLALAGRIGLSTGRTTIKDVPLLIKMLSVEADGVCDEARRTLAILAGRDLGCNPAPWEEWWAERSRVLLAHEADCRSSALLFHELKRDIITGRWPHVRETLSAQLRDRLSTETLSRMLTSSAATLRKAYRDAEVAGLCLDESGDVLVVDWGEQGFAFTELPIVREGDGWRFDAPPWADELVASPPRDMPTAGGPVRRHRWRRSVFSLSWPRKLALAVATAVAIPTALGLVGAWLSWLPDWASKWGSWAFQGAFLLMLPGALIYVTLIRPLPNSRQLRDKLRRKR